MSHTDRPNKADLKADWVDYVRSLDPDGVNGDPESLTKEDLIDLADELEDQQADTGAETSDPGIVEATGDDRVGEGGVVDRSDPSDTTAAGTAEAGETRTAEATGSGDVAQGPDLSGYHTTTAGPTPARTSGQRSETTSAVTDRAPEDAERLAGEQTPATSDRIMGLPDSPRAGETGQGH